MKVLPEKRKELLQTIRALLKLMRTESGCAGYRFYQDTEDNNNFSLVSEWETHADLDRHLLSGRFGILLGAAIQKQTQDTHITTIAPSKATE